MRKTIRNPMFWADVVTPLMDQFIEGETNLRVVMLPRSGEGLEIEVEIRVVRIGKTLIPMRPEVLRRSHLKKGGRKP